MACRVLWFDSKTFVRIVQCLSNVSHVLDGTSAHDKFACDNEETRKLLLANACMHVLTYQCTSVSSLKVYNSSVLYIHAHGSLLPRCTYHLLVATCQDVSSLGRGTI